MIGKRHDLKSGDGLEVGEYGKHEVNGKWYCQTPVGMGNLGSHEVIEHEDGTITVSPSILVTHHSGDSWHGYLERGVWREV